MYILHVLVPEKEMLQVPGLKKLFIAVAVRKRNFNQCAVDSGLNQNVFEVTQLLF